ncbi:MAG: AMP-binding protein [Verrucomicrobiota bacterium]|jgi:excisionase family DNA binding protein
MNIELCCAEEVAHALGIKLDTLYRYARKGRIRGMKVGKSWRFLHTDIQEFLQQHQYNAETAEPSQPAQVQPTLLPDILRRAALQSGVQRAITCGGAETSYAELDKASDLLADCLLSYGVVPADRVLILLSNSLEFISACFAVWKAGAIVVAQDPSLQDQNLRLILRDCSPQALIVDRAVAERLDVRHHGLENLRVVYVKDRAIRLPGLDGLRVESLDSVLENKTNPALLRLNNSSPDDVATITYPGGAAGSGQGVMNTHKNWLAGAAFKVEYLGLTKQDVLLLPLPIHQSLALRQILAYVMAGARIILASNLGQAVKLMKDRLPSALALRPGSVKLLLEKPSLPSQKLAGSLRYVEIGSAPLEEGEFESLRRLLPNTLIHASCNLTEAQPAFLQAGPDGSLNRIGRLPPTLSLTIVDEQRREAPPGQSGRVLLKGPGLMKGFWGQSEHEMAMLILEGYCPGDRAATDKRGEVILLARMEETLSIRGHKINPAEVEAVLRRHVSVADCAVVGLLDAAGGFETRVHAFVVPNSKGAMLTERDLKAYCRVFLPSSQVPARIHFQASLPKSEEGRISLRTLKGAAQVAGQGQLRKVKSEIPRILVPQS